MEHEMQFSLFRVISSSEKTKAYQNKAVLTKNQKKGRGRNNRKINHHLSKKVKKENNLEATRTLYSFPG